jgi:hypothetical protein
MLRLGPGGRLPAIGARLRAGVGHLVAALGELARHQLASHLISNLARQLFQFDEGASSSQPLLFPLGKLIDDP